ncbi:MAG: DNA-processing protein DprA [Clostridia bacterium]|nr:DNA-processing protein DprA [Clostridia bacterium]
MNVLYELWLQSICGFEPEMVEKAAFLFEGKKNRFSSPEMEEQRLRRNGVPKEISKRVSEEKYLELAKNVEEYCNQNGIRIITQESDEYPQLLKHINTPPRILFAKGEKLSLSSRVSVSVVGSRKPTPQGKSVARQIGYDLAENGVAVISGMAEGIDAEAHKGALEGGGKTVAVLAGSVDVIYPKSNEKLYYEIMKNGTVISERPPGTAVKPYFYQQRNRIVVGLSQGTVVVEGKAKSGTSITARLALENNRDVFAVPGSLLNWQSELPNILAGDGAIIVDKISRVSEYYKEMRPELFEEKRVEKRSEKVLGLSAEDEKILEFIVRNGGMSGSEEMLEELGFAPNVLSSRLTILCIRGILRQESGNRYVLLKY